MKAVILAGGYGTRISEETHLRPKPMVNIGDKPILWHILKSYSFFGINEFIICCGYKGYAIKEYFTNYFLHTSDVSIDLSNNNLTVHRRNSDKWKITLVDTGEFTMTGGRLKRIKDYVGTESFCFTYGDGVSDIDMNSLLKKHNELGVEATVTAVQPPARFGVLEIEPNGNVKSFIEKPTKDTDWISGGFFILEPSVFSRIEGDETIWEQEPMKSLARDGQLGAYRHTGFWHPMDTLRDKTHLEELWLKGHAPWQLWA